MEMHWPEVLEFCQQTTAEIALVLTSQFAKVTADRKQDGSLVTVADQWTDQELRQRLGQRFPTHGLLTEETTHIFPANDWCWVIDPIDGTTNFTRGIPIWGISLGLLYRGTPVFGFVHFPLLQQSFWGYWFQGSGLTGLEGAYLNGEPLQVSLDPPSSNHLFNLCARSMAMMVQPFPCKFRLMGVASYNILLVAAGTALGGVEKTPKIWDIAGAWPILRAAGGSFLFLGSDSLFPLQVGRDYGGYPVPCLTASQPSLLELFRPLVMPILEPSP
jgi:myo-inositol-1(or 4)-monophosphatase